MALGIWHLPASENQCSLRAKWLYILNLFLCGRTGDQRGRDFGWHGRWGRCGLWRGTFLKGPANSYHLLFFIFCYSKMPVYCWCTAPGTGGTFLHWKEGFLKETMCPLSVHLKMGQKRQMQYIQHKIQHWEQQKAVTKPQKEQKLPGFSWQLWSFYKIKPSCWVIYISSFFSLTQLLLTECVWYTISGTKSLYIQG